MYAWEGFIAIIILFLALDLGVFNRKSHEISNKEAGIWTAIWVVLSLAFTTVIYWLYKDGTYIDNPTNLSPTEASMKYVTGYLVEKSLSIDNIFVIAVIFSSFSIPKMYQHKVLFWGILGAIVFRAIMIFLGIALISKFSWMTYVFGIFLLFTAAKMLFKGEDQEFNPKKSFIYRWLRRIMPITKSHDGGKFFVKRRHITAATPLFVALIVIELMDVMFAVDSVPAVLAITEDPFIVFTSNIFAILGLRSMYFFLANMIEKFSYLEYSLIAILTFVGIKMLIVHHFKMPEWASLGFITLALLAGIFISLAKNKEVKISNE